MINADTDMNADVKANVNPPQAEVRKISYHPFNINAFKTLQDVCDYLNSSTMIGCHDEIARDLLNFVLNNLDAFEQSCTFEDIETMFKLLATKTSIMDVTPLELCCSTFWTDKATQIKEIDLLEKLIDFGKKDARYFELVEYLLTVQAIANDSIPIACDLATLSDFEPRIMKKLPADVQRRLREATFYEENPDTGRMYCYALLTYQLVYVD